MTGQTCVNQHVFGDLCLHVQLAQSDELFDQAQVDDCETQSVRLAEATLRQAAMDRHLAALEALDAHARTRGLALAAAAGLLAALRALPASDATMPAPPTMPGEIACGRHDLPPSPVA